MSPWIVRRAANRGHVHTDWLNSWHTFSFGHYYDPAWMGFGVLRVINDDTVQPGKGFNAHGHANMEILSFVLEGQLAHQDTLGTKLTLDAGEVQCMSAGAGIEHSEFNGSDTERVHFLQVWIQPDRVNATPRHAQAHFAPTPNGEWTLLASPEGAQGSLPIRQDVRVMRGSSTSGVPLQVTIEGPRRLWVQVIEGDIEVAGNLLQAGDGAGIEAFTGPLAIESKGQGTLLLFDLPV